MLFQDRKEFPSFRECIELEMDLIEQKDPAFEPGLLRRGVYYKQLESYTSVFSGDQVMVVGFKQFLHDLESTLDKIYQFVGVGSIDAKELGKEPKNTRAYLEPMPTSDRQLLDDFYAEPNEKLFGKYGEISW